MSNANEMIERFRFDKLRAANVSALKHASTFLVYAEDGQADHPEAYQELISLVRVLAVGLSDGAGD